MGNPVPQLRTNASKANLKPKHRHSGSVSNISFSSEDPKPKHRRTGSVSNISITPEDVKPKHRRTGSVSNISITPEDVNPRHRHSGSVSNISINSEDFISPSRDVRSPSLVASSSVSLKEKKLKRRTRSSLGGTEDFIKELDFLTPSSNGRTPDSSTCKDPLKPSHSLPTSESAPLEAASEALAPVPEASAPGHAEGIVESLPLEQANSPVAEKVGVGENGGSPHDNKSVSWAKGSVQPGDAVHQLAEPERNGVDRGNPSTVEMSRDKQDPALNEIGEHDSQVESPSALENGHLHVAALGTPLLGTSTKESDCTEPADNRTHAEEVAESILEVGPPPESLVSDAGIGTIPQNTSGQEEFTTSKNSEPSVTNATIAALTNGDSEAAPSKEEWSQNEHGAKEMQEEKVSVQKRIEELEKIAGGRPVHFRSQSLSLPRPFDICHARHHEAEGSKEFRMPVYRAPLDSTSVSEVGSLELVGTSQDEELSKASLYCEVKTYTESSFPTHPASTESSAQNTESQNVLHDEEKRLASQPVRSSSDQVSDHTKRHVGPIISEAAKAVEVSPDSMLSGSHLESGTTNGSFESLPVINKAESMEESETPHEIEAHGTTVEHNLVEIGKEDGLESGLGEAYVMVSADSVPEEALLIPKELHTGASSDQTKGNGGKLETVTEAAEAGVEASPGAHQTGKLPEAAETGMLPVTHQRSPLPELPLVQTSPGEQPRKGFETSLLLTKQPSKDFETSLLLTKQPAVDPLFIDSQQDRLWEMHSQELTLGASSGQEVRESSAQDDDPRQHPNGNATHAEVAPAGSTSNGNAQSDKSVKADRPRTPLRSLLAEEDAEKCPDSEPLGTPPQNQSGSPRGNLFKRIVSGGKNSPTQQTTPPKFSPKSQPAAKSFLSSCICCSVK